MREGLALASPAERSPLTAATPPTWAMAIAKDGGYSAVSVLAQTPFTLTLRSWGVALHGRIGLPAAGFWESC